MDTTREEVDRAHARLHLLELRIFALQTQARTQPCMVGQMEYGSPGDAAVRRQFLLDRAQSDLRRVREFLERRGNAVPAVTAGASEVAA